MSEHRSDREHPDLQLAAEAAATGDLEMMVSALFRSGCLDGLRRILVGHWSEVPEAELDYAVSRGVDALYETVRDGRPVRNVPGLIYRVADRAACDYHRLRVREQLVLDRGQQDQYASDSENPQHQGPDPDALRADALRHARALLPRLGQTNVQRVMSIVFDAVEARVDELSNEDIASALGLSIDTVKQSKSRGFRRLQRIAGQEGLAGPNLFAALEHDPDAAEDETWVSRHRLDVEEEGY